MCLVSSAGAPAKTRIADPEAGRLSLIRSVLRETKTLWLESFCRKPIAIALERPIVSVTFDDVPLSAYQYGVPILKELNARATFYVALNIGNEVHEQFLGPPEIVELHNHGHEIGCHTYSHYRLSTGEAGGLALDAATNRAQLSHLLGDSGPKSFAFPYGELSLSAKQNLQSSYQSLRSIRPGINHGSTDLNCLKSYLLGAGNSTQAYISGLLDKAERNNGWLILYTHGVLSNPGTYDTTPAALEFVMSECRRRGIEMLPVVRAIQVMGGSLPRQDSVRP